MCVVHGIALSPIHYVVVLRRLICNYSADASNGVSRTCQVCHLHWAIERLHSSVAVGVSSTCSFPGDVARWSSSCRRGDGHKPAVCWALVIFRHSGRCDLEALQVLVFRTYLGSCLRSLNYVVSVTMRFLTSLRSTWYSSWAWKSTFIYSQWTYTEGCALLLARIFALVRFMAGWLLIMMLLLHWLMIFLIILHWLLLNCSIVFIRVLAQNIVPLVIPVS